MYQLLVEVTEVMAVVLVQTRAPRVVTSSSGDILMLTRFGTSAYVPSTSGAKDEETPTPQEPPEPPKKPRRKRQQAKTTEGE